MKRLLLVLFATLRYGPLSFALRKARRYGTLIMQETTLEHGQGWHCQLRAHARDGLPRYSWTAYGYTMTEAIRGALHDARDYPIDQMVEIQKITTAAHAPKLGGAEFDE
jgi:hypothetical protein